MIIDLKTLGLRTGPAKLVLESKKDVWRFVVGAAARWDPKDMMIISGSRLKMLSYGLINMEAGNLGWRPLYEVSS